MQKGLTDRPNLMQFLNDPVLIMSGECTLMTESSVASLVQNNIFNVPFASLLALNLQNENTCQKFAKVILHTWRLSILSPWDYT